MRTAWLLAGICAATFVAAGDYTAGHLVVTQPWSRPTPPGVSVGAVYTTISNRGEKPDRLIGVSTPVATAAEMHETRIVRGVMEMRPVASVELPPGANVRIETGAIHIMLLGLAHPLVANTEFPLSLRFQEAGVITVRARVLAPD